VVLCGFRSSSDEKASETKHKFTGPVESIRDLHRHFIEQSGLGQGSWGVAIDPPYRHHHFDKIAKV
jgi:hypothetical protein